MDVRWQDGTLTTGEPARTLVPILPAGTDFHAGDFVTEKSDEDPSAAAGEQNASAALTRTGIIRSVNARERTCAVSWAAGPGTGSQDTPDGSAAPPAVVARVPAAVGARTRACCKAALIPSQVALLDQNGKPEMLEAPHPKMKD